MTGPWLLYGAYGFTGELIARRAVEEGMAPVLSGRNAGKVRVLAAELGLEARPARLEDAAALRAALSGMEAVVHAAGPFVRTWRAMAAACLETGTHYLDITGEIEALEGLASLDGHARRAGVALVPSVGFDVVPTDCLAARLARALPGADRLEIAFESDGTPSSGTARGMVQSFERPPLERRGGKILPIEGGVEAVRVPFSDGERTGVPVSWGDVATAWHSTGIPDIRTYMVVPEGLAAWYRRLVAIRPLLAPGPVRAALEWLAARLVSDPDPERGSCRVWAQVRTAGGRSVSGELATPGGYAFTAASAAAAVRELLGEGPAGRAGGQAGAASRADRPRSGFLTPSMAFGPGFVDRIEGTRWIRRPEG
ncbi:MAG TPA: saccharopine dehydrogenase NADP-binding domain-containing protein [Gemmatimonadota bacterium]|nr:saccharopine dehydrogenase NADP-binding domain-containing protein [Gemmatimonadota bacterium]